MIPEAVLTCTPAPDVPGDPVTDNALATYILRLAAAGDDCRSNLSEVKGLLK